MELVRWEASMPQRATLHVLRRESVRGHQVMIHKSAKRWWLTDPDAMTSLFLKDVFSSCKTKRWRGVWADALKDRASPGSTPGLRRYLVGVWPDAPKCRSQI